MTRCIGCDALHHANGFGPKRPFSPAERRSSLRFVHECLGRYWWTKVRGRGRLALVALAGATVLLARSRQAVAQAQLSVRSVNAEDACGSCLVLRQVAVVGSDSGRGLVQWGRTLVRLRGGRLLHGRTPDGMPVFDSTGQLIASVGRLGSGPSEFRSIQSLAVGPGDTVHVFDAGNQRHSILGPDLEVVRSFPSLGSTYDAVVLSTGQVVRNASVPMDDLWGLPLHLIAPTDGRRVRSFGRDPNEPFVPDDAWAGRRELTAGPRGTVYAARRNEYRIEKWDTSGAFLGGFVRNADWFRPYTRPPRLGPEAAPSPSLERIHRDSSNRLWILITVPDRHWRRNLRPAGRGPRLRYEPTHPNGIFDTVIEVLDLDTGVLLMSQRTPHFLWGFLGDGVVFGDGTGPDGVPRFSVWRLDTSLRPMTKGER